MELKALIIEQLDENGTLKTLRMSPDNDTPLIVAFAEEYEEERNGPFHFLDNGYEEKFTNHFANTKIRKLGKSFFTIENESFFFKSSWKALPTSQGSLTYYSLLLPKFAIPKKVVFLDPRSGKEYSKYIYRDNEKNRYVIYLECRSSYGTFDFTLEVEFILSKENFSISTYSDEKLVDLYGMQPDMYQNFYRMSEKNIIQINQFFQGETTMGDKYEAGQVGAQGANAHAHDMTFNQIWHQNRGEIDLNALNDDLIKLRSAMQTEASSAEHYSELGAIANAEIEAKKGNEVKTFEALSKVGKWSLNIAEKIGVGVATAAIKTSLGI